MSSKDVNYYTAEAESHIEAGKYDMAIEAYSKAIVLDNNDCDLYYERGLLYAATEKYEKAIEDFNKCADVVPDTVPDSYEIYLRRGICYLSVGKEKEAMKDLIKSIDIFPNFHAYRNRGAIYYQNGNLGNSLNDFLEAEKILEEGYEYMIFLAIGHVLWDLNRKSEARSYYKKSLEFVDSSRFGVSDDSIRDMRARL
ncbi:MAG: tetratricopeptide repeat protein [Defluviitaleaceae bacterium]|nr:tetratricopeptide repeat protein [Defluviitaleaceae bacterium]